MSEEDNANSDTETESTEEEIEPKFKYQRIKNDLKNLLDIDVVTCSAVHPKFLIFGTYLGRIYLFDHQGNSVASYLNAASSECSHSVAVNHIDVDSKGENVATCADDGRVFIAGLFSNEGNQNIRFDKSIKAVALDPDAKSAAGKRFIVGDNKLTLYEKNFLNKLKSSVLCTAEGGVLSVCWNGAYVAWASHLGVRVYDLNEKCSLGLMKWEEPLNARLENFRCNFRWSNATTLLIGWVDTIRICVIRKRNSIEAASALPGYVVDPVSTFQTSFYICGLAPLIANQLVVLGFPKLKDEQRKALRPVFCVVDYKLNSSEEVSIDSLSLRGFKDYTVNDYSLGCIIEENRYFIVAPRDIVVASLYDTNSRVDWLKTHGKFDEALELIYTSGGNNEKLLEVASAYIDHLLTLKQYEAAAKVCLNVFGNNKALWETVVFKFVKCQQLRAVSAYLPTNENCRLEQHVYEIVLYELLLFDAKGFLNLIKEWPSTLYNCSAVINAIHDNFRKQYANELLEALAILYSHQKEYESALRMYLRLQNKDVFGLIRRQDLYSVIHKMLIPLIELDRDKAFEILLDKSKIPPEIVVQQLEQNQEFLYLYLDALERVDKRGTFHWKLVNLYAKYEPKKLLPFLKRSNHYPIQEALDICKRELFYPEMVYLLGHMGNTIEALNIIIHKVKDVVMAIDFCKEYDDSDLWNVLIDESVENPDIMTKLLDGLVGYVSPEDLINKIKIGQKIPGLRKSVIKMLWDYRLQVQIQEGCNSIQLDDYFKLHDDLVSAQNCGRSIDLDNVCEVCRRSVLTKASVPRNDIIVFSCGHHFHEICLPDNVTTEQCCVCNVNYDEDSD